tara:strand:- start:17060 stop:17401 length:342 start_codon:yes stop_codon:yes gene_type:complete
MKKIIRLTESDLARIVRRIIKEDNKQTPKVGDSVSIYNENAPSKKNFFGTVCSVDGIELILKQNISPYKCISYYFHDSNVQSKTKNGNTTSYEIVQDDPIFSDRDCKTYCKSK